MIRDVDRLALIDPVNVARGVSTEVFSNVHWLKNWYQRKLTGQRVEILGQTVYGAAVPSAAWWEEQLDAGLYVNPNDPIDEAKRRSSHHFSVVDHFKSDIENFLVG